MGRMVLFGCYFFFKVLAQRPKVFTGLTVLGASNETGGTVSQVGGRLMRAWATLPTAAEEAI